MGRVKHHRQAPQSREEQELASGWEHPERTGGQDLDHDEGHEVGHDEGQGGRHHRHHPEGDHHGEHYASPQDSSHPEGPSKSQVKREHHAVQELAERLVGLPRSELERLTLSEATWAAIDETSRIKDIRALGRHYKRIANLLAREDMAAVATLLHGQERVKQEETARLHRLERWRERLITEGDQALAELLEAQPEIDRQQLRALIRTARKDCDQAKGEGSRRLFRWLRDVLR